jgi:hypothetical protein
MTKAKSSSGGGLTKAAAKAIDSAKKMEKKLDKANKVIKQAKAKAQILKVKVAAKVKVAKIVAGVSIKK